MAATQQRNEQRKLGSNNNPGARADLDLLSSALRFGGELVDLVDEDLATELYGLADADGFDAKTHAADHDWHWIAASSSQARARMAMRVRALVEARAN